MEIPDVVVVNKADHPLAATMVREIRSVLALAPPSSWRVPVLSVEAQRGEGVEELEGVLVAHRAQLEAEGTLAQRRRRNLRSEVIALAAAGMRRALEERLARDAGFEELLDEVVARRLDPASAARRISADDG